MAEKGFEVIAFDITPEMVEEGKKRYGALNGLKLVTADLLELDLGENNIDFTFIAGYGYLHLLPTIQDVEKAFVSLYN